MSEKSALWEMLNLKFQQRQGWILPGRNIPEHEVESVADHSWGAGFLAELLLPETAEALIDVAGYEKGVEDYSKQKIIRMLIVHDLSEAKTGDIAVIHKTPGDVQKERNNMQAYRNIFSREKSLYFDVIYSLWDEFDKQNSLNARIAKDIDQLECYVQLWGYKRQLIEINGQAGWERLKISWKENLNCTTLFGKWMLQWVEQKIGI